MKNMHKLHKKKQAGFTIVEIGIVMVILIGLVLAFSSGLWEKQTASDINLIQQFFEKDMPLAMASCRTRKANILENMDQTELLDCGGLPDRVVGIGWTSTNVTNGLTTITMDLVSMSENVDVGNGVIANLTSNAMSHIDLGGSSYAGTTLTVVVRVR